MGLLEGPRQVPAVKMHRAMRILQTMVSRCLVPRPARAARSLLERTERSGRGQLLFCLLGCGRGLEVSAALVTGGETRRGKANAARLTQLLALQRPAHFCSIRSAKVRGRLLRHQTPPTPAQR